MTLIDTFNNRLQKAMDNCNMKQVDLVEKTGLDKTLINKYLAGIMKAKQDKLTILANALNVNEVWLMGYDIPMDKNLKLDELGNPVVSIPIIGLVKAGYDYLAQENWIGTTNLDKKVADSGDFFALKVKGDSMVPIFFEGDIVVFRKQNYCENNQVAVVIVNGDEGTLKKVKKLDNGGIKLIPYNRSIDPETGEPFYEDMTFTPKEIDELPVVIVGVFQELKRTELKF